MIESNIYVDFDTMHRFMKDVFVRAGVPDEDAVVCADVLIAADKRGIDSHGINRLKPIYYDRIKEKIINPITKIDVVREAPAVAVLDGNNGMGQVIGKKAMQIAMDKASKYGIGMVTVRNSNHYGIAGYYGLMCSDNNMIGITGTNARPSIAPTFGVENMLGTNPLTFVMPSDEPFPFFLDCATSVSQRGRIEVYAREGKQLPDGWVIGADGKSKTDAVKILDELVKGDAALVPLGGIGDETAGFKGYGYATVVEILSSALQAGSYLKMLNGITNGVKTPYHLGHFFIAVDIKAFTEVDDFKKIVGNILRDLRVSKKMPGHDRIFSPGEKEWIVWNERKDKGVPLDGALIKDIKTLVKELGLTGYDFKF